MADDLLKNVQEMLNEEKWTRATLSNYSTNQFKELDVLLKEARDARVLDELKKTCDEHLGHTKNSIIALYLSGMVALSRQIIDDSTLINLVTIFVGAENGDPELRQLLRYQADQGGIGTVGAFRRGMDHLEHQGPGCP